MNNHLKNTNLQIYIQFLKYSHNNKINIIIYLFFISLLK